MIRRYQFCAPPHHQFQAGSAVFHGGEEFNLEEAHAVDPRLVNVGERTEAETAPEPDPIMIEPEAVPEPQPDPITIDPDLTEVEEEALKAPAGPPRPRKP